MEAPTPTMNLAVNNNHGFVDIPRPKAPNAANKIPAISIGFRLNNLSVHNPMGMRNRICGIEYDASTIPTMLKGTPDD